MKVVRSNRAADIASVASGTKAKGLFNLGEKSMKQKVLSTTEAMHLKWFCQNVVGCRQDFYEVFDKANKFDERLQRLEKTCGLIEKFLGEKIEPFYFKAKP